jgi:hypothetical protein
MGNFKYKIKEASNNILKPNQVDQALIKRIEAKYGPVDMKNDFFSRDLKTYFKNQGIDKETGGSTSQVIKLASFGDSLEKMNDAVKALQTLMGTDDGRNDSSLKSIANDLKKTFNTYRTHLRKNYPDQYAQIKGTLDEISALGSDSGFTSGGEGENHNGPSPRKSTYGAYTQAGYKKVTEGPGATFGPGPVAGPEGVTNNTYVKDFKYKLVDKKKLNKAAKGIIVKPLWEANTDVEEYLTGLNITDPDKKKFIASRLLGFDELERKLNELIPFLQQAKHETMDYYRENPDSFAVLYGTDLANDYVNDLIELFKK